MCCPEVSLELVSAEGERVEWDLRGVMTLTYLKKVDCWLKWICLLSYYGVVRPLVGGCHKANSPECKSKCKQLFEKPSFLKMLSLIWPDFSILMLLAQRNLHDKLEFFTLAKCNLAKTKNRCVSPPLHPCARPSVTENISRAVKSIQVLLCPFAGSLLPGVASSASFTPP